MFSLAVPSGGWIVRLLESLGFHGFSLFLAVLALFLVILGVSYLLATWGLNSRKKKS
jgi:hypothetical protein